jgi:hypothetical protein
MVTNDAICTREIKSRVAIAKGAFYKKKALFTRKFDLSSKEETGKVLHLEYRIVQGC